ncbi:MAG: DUF1566 domain-containing protein [Methylovulum sp.]|nr:DUF1566 domain-containing protein [Methylovulum sp.]
MKPHLLSFLKILFCTLALCAWQGAYAVPTTPTSDFIDNGDGTVTHKTTGLIWQRGAVGQTWTGSDCSGEVKGFSYAEAMALKSDFAGQSDWRLPNIAELQTILERENFNPVINTTIFPNT